MPSTSFVFRGTKATGLPIKILAEKKRAPYTRIYADARISERMFRFMRNSRIPSKQSLIALLISLGMRLEEMDDILPKAGYVLSRSIAFDAVVRVLLECREPNPQPRLLVFSMNSVLAELNLPLLGTREIRDAQQK